VAKQLPPRPNLDHLRGQAKSLLASLAAGDAAAAATFREFLPAAQGMSAAQVRAAGFRLADAQSAVARQSGFAAWPQLARHVQQLRALEGTWSFERLEIDGAAVPPEGLRSSRLLLDGDRFRTESPEATYEGVFNINVEAQPHEIDIEFVAGPEAGNWNYGVFRVEGDQLEICLDMSGRSRPKEFRTAPGSGHACETLRRVSDARPPSVLGGNPPVNAVTGSTSPAGCSPPATAPTAASQQDAAGFEYVASDTLIRLQGEWSAERLVRNGQEVPATIRATGRRSAKGNDVKVSIGGQQIIHALVRINERTDPIQIDYFNLAGPAKGTVQLGIMEWRGGRGDVCFCMAAPGGPRPADFECAAGSGATLSQWRPKR
jgi:uncharacterized protein (TIGR03067 family)